MPPREVAEESAKRKGKGMNATTQRAKVLDLAKKQIQERHLTWVKGKGFAVDFKAICVSTELKYPVVCRTIWAAFMPEEERVDVTGWSRTRLGHEVALRRVKEDLSWGYLAIQFGVGEGLIRTVFAEYTGFSSKGLRNGNGGRFVADRHDLYAGELRKPKGSEIELGIRPSEAAPTERYVLPTKVRKQRAQKAKVEA